MEFICSFGVLLCTRKLLCLGLILICYLEYFGWCRFGWGQISGFSNWTFMFVLGCMSTEIILSWSDRVKFLWTIFFWFRFCSAYMSSFWKCSFSKNILYYFYKTICAFSEHLNGTFEMNKYWRKWIIWKIFAVLLWFKLKLNKSKEHFLQLYCIWKDRLFLMEK